VLLKGTVAEGLPDWDQGRPQPVKYIDFENWANNDFLVINQFKVELTSADTSSRTRVLFSDLPLKADEKTEAQAEIATIEAQLSSSRPKEPIIKRMS
jgi:hypothetical protein